MMPTRNVNLTDELDRFVLKKVKSGRYENASEVVRDALRTLEREEQEYEAKLSALREAIDAGDSSGIAKGNVFGRVRNTLDLRRSPALAVSGFRLSRRAENDLLNIGAYTRHTWGEDQAARYLDAQESCCQLLADNPALGRACTHILRMASGRHVPFYREE